MVSSEKHRVEGYIGTMYMYIYIYADIGVYRQILLGIGLHREYIRVCRHIWFRHRLAGQ